MSIKNLLKSIKNYREEVEKQNENLVKLIIILRMM